MRYSQLIYSDASGVQHTPYWTWSVKIGGQTEIGPHGKRCGMSRNARGSLLNVPLPMIHPLSLIPIASIKFHPAPFVRREFRSIIVVPL